MSLVSFSYTTVFCKQVNTGYFLISFSLGNSRLPFAHRLTGNIHQVCKLFLGKAFLPPQPHKVIRKGHIDLSFCF